MRRFVFYIFISALFFTSELSAQEVIVADATGGCDTLLVNFSLNNARLLEEYASVRWDFGDGSTAANTLNPSHLYVLPGMYEVICNLDERPTDVVLDEKIVVSQTPYADFKYIDTSTVDLEYSYYFFPAYFRPIDGLHLNYEWTFHDASVITDSTVIYSYDAEGNYLVNMKVTDQNGCADSTSRLVSIHKKLDIPNVFSPNGDQINDYFIVPTTGHFAYKLRIFSSSGLQLFYIESPIIQWDGRSSTGSEVPEGIYYYTIESDETPVKTSEAGFVYLYK